jgi:hypothetical protein
MNPTSPFGFPQFDPSKMDPQVLMQLSQIIQQLPPEQLNRMQTLMHNAMAGHDVQKDMEEFERNLPPGFREKLMGLMAGQSGAAFGATPPMAESVVSASGNPGLSTEQMNLHEARMTILRAVADGRMPPDQAEKLLFA